MYIVYSNDAPAAAPPSATTSAAPKPGRPPAPVLATSDGTAGVLSQLWETFWEVETGTTVLVISDTGRYGVRFMFQNLQVMALLCGEMRKLREES